MKRRNYKGCELLPLAVCDTARAGDSDAVEQVLRYYEGYINKLWTRTVYDESGCPHTCLDEYMKSHLENKLIRAILGMN
ncbi:helix-turn-helix domain-containing protein [Oscillospiraceae bacterium 50-60]